ncbi:MAG: hypothetical protein JXA20_20320 [Spirochaetes bacterium]|nr:hypothetical protein [Spirochaetota bacterium]
MHAILSVNASDEIRDMPANYRIPTGVPIYGPHGTSKIVDDWADLLDGSIDATLRSVGISDTDNVWWSGSESDGSLSADTCVQYTSNDSGDWGNGGLTSKTDTNWIYGGTWICTESLYVVCVGQK